MKDPITIARAIPNGGPVRLGDPFFISRRKEAERVCRAVESDIGVAVVFAPKRSGKATFLAEICDRGLVSTASRAKRLLKVQLVEWGPISHETRFKDLAQRILEAAEESGIRLPKGAIALGRADCQLRNIVNFQKWIAGLSRTLGGGLVIAIDDLAPLRRGRQLTGFLSMVRQSRESKHGDLRWILFSPLPQKEFDDLAWHVSLYPIDVFLHDLPEDQLRVSLRSGMRSLGLDVKPSALRLLTRQVGGHAYLAHRVLAFGVRHLKRKSTHLLVDESDIKRGLRELLADHRDPVFAIPAAELSSDESLLGGFAHVCRESSSPRLASEIRGRLEMLGLLHRGSSAPVLRAPVFRKHFVLDQLVEAYFEREIYPPALNAIRPRERGDRIGITVADMREFKYTVERQFQGKIPNEDIGRGYLQFFIEGRRLGRFAWEETVREELSGGGYIDLVLGSSGTKTLFETKIWGGPSRHKDGLLQIAQYASQTHAGRLYYVVFDRRRRKPKWAKGSGIIREKVDGRAVYIVFIWVGKGPPSKPIRKRRKRSDRPSS